MKANMAALATAVFLLVRIITVSSAKANVIRIPVFVDLVGGYKNAATINASALPYPGVRTWEVLAATELAVAAVNEQTAILPQHDIRLDIYDCLSNPAEAAFRVTAATKNETNRPPIIIAPVIDDTAFMVSIIASQMDVPVYLDSSSKITIGGGIMNSIITSSSPSSFGQGVALADIMLHLGFTRCVMIREATRDFSTQMDYLEGIRQRAAIYDAPELFDREVTQDEKLIRRALTDIKLLGIGAIVLVPGASSSPVWTNLVMSMAKSLGMLSGTYAWFANSALLSLPTLSATFGSTLDGFVGLRVPWTMTNETQRSAYQARWQAAYTSTPQSVYRIPSSILGERRYNTVWRIARALHDFEELKTYCADTARNTSVYARIAQYPNSSCTATPSVWPPADTQEQLCCIMARADLGHHVTSPADHTVAEKQDKWWSRTAVLSRLMWKRSTMDAEGDAGFGWSQPDGATKNAFQIVNIINGSAQVVGTYGLNGDAAKPVQLSVSQVVWMSGAKNRPSNDVMVTRPLREDTTSLVVIILTIASIGFIYASGLLFFNTKWREHPVVRLSSYKINNVTIIGVCFSLAFIIIYAIRDRFDDAALASRICQSEVWCLTLSFTLGFGSLFAKTYRVHRLFNSKQLRARSIHDSFLFGIVGAMVLFDVILLSVWQETDPLRWQPVNQLIKSEGTERVQWLQYSCTSTHRPVFLLILCAEKGLILFFGAYIAFRVRDVSIPELNDSKWIGFSIYNVTVLFLLMSPVFFLQSSVSRIVGLTVVGLSILLMSYLVLSLLFLPKIWAVHQSSKEAGNVIEAAAGDGQYSGCATNQVAPLNSVNGAGAAGKVNTVTVNVKPSHLRKGSIEYTVLGSRQPSGRSIHVGTAPATPTSVRGLGARTESSLVNNGRPDSSPTNGSQTSPVRDQARVRELEDLLKKVRNQLKDAREQQRLGRIGMLQNFSAGVDSVVTRLSSHATTGHRLAGGTSPRSTNSVAADPSEHDVDEPSLSKAVAPLHRLQSMSVSRRGFAYLAPMQDDSSADVQPEHQESTATAGSQSSALASRDRDGTTVRSTIMVEDGRSALLSPLEIAADSEQDVTAPREVDYPINTVQSSEEA